LIEPNQLARARERGIRFTDLAAGLSAHCRQVRLRHSLHRGCFLAHLELSVAREEG